jgi:hypothetical protein
MRLIAAGTLALAANAAHTRAALAWGDEGHQVVALIAQSFLEADVRKRINALLAADTDDLTAHDIASAATWADKFRDANFEGSRAKTRQSRALRTQHIPADRRLRYDRHGRCCAAVEQSRRAACVRSE